MRSKHHPMLNNHTVRRMHDSQPVRKRERAIITLRTKQGCTASTRFHQSSAHWSSNRQGRRGTQRRRFGIVQTGLLALGVNLASYERSSHTQVHPPVRPSNASPVPSPRRYVGRRRMRSFIVNVKMIEYCHNDGTDHDQAREFGHELMSYGVKKHNNAGKEKQGKK